MIGDEIKYLLIPEPPSRLAMNFQRGRFKEQQVAAVFQGSHISVKRLPVIAYQRYSAGGGELPGDARSC